MMTLSDSMNMLWKKMNNIRPDKDFISSMIWEIYEQIENT
jgi:hypothetical protein